MWSYAVNRIVQAVVVVVAVTLITFLALHMSGDPTYLYASDRATDEEIAILRERLGFDRPLHVQYLSFLGGLATGNAGNSLRYGTSAMGIVIERLPATVELTLMAMLIAVTFAIPLGVFAALHRGTAIDGGIMALAMVGQSIPSFWLGIMLILGVGLGLSWLPISGHVAVIDPLLKGDFGRAWTNLPDAVRYLIMPAFTISLFSMSRNARLVRSSMLEVLSQDYVRTARAKGQREWVVVIHHALRNAWMPVVTMLGLEFGFLLSGVVVVETVFSWPGVGRLVFNAINQRDVPLVQSAVVVFAGVFVLLNLFVDLLYARLDSRVRLS
jgi:peptide/nickel transport system permease protein